MNRMKWPLYSWQVRGTDDNVEASVLTQIVFGFVMLTMFRSVMAGFGVSCC